MDYVRLAPQNKQAIIENRLAELEAAHYNESLSLAELEQQDDGSDQIRMAIAQCKAGLNALDEAHERMTKKLQDLIEPPVET